MKRNFFKLMALLCFTMNITAANSQSVGNTVSEVAEKFIDQNVSFIYYTDDTFYYIFERNEEVGTERQFVFDQETRRCVTIQVRIFNELALTGYIEVLNNNKNLVIKQHDRVWQTQDDLYGSMSFRLVKRKDFEPGSNKNVVAVLKISWTGSVFDNNRF